MNPERWLIAIGAGRWQLRGINAARTAGLKVLAIDGLANAPGLALADKSLVVDIRDADTVITAILASGVIPSGAIAFSNEAGMLTTAAVRDHFNLPGARMEVVYAMTRKDRQRQLWTDAQLPCPRWFVARNPEEVETALHEIDDRAIIKPVDSAGSRGVTVIDKDAPWLEAFQAALSFSPSKHVIIESFIVGVEHTVETFSHEGRTQVLAITAKKKVPGTSNTVASELATAVLSDDKRNELGNICVSALAALGYRDGPGHTEVLQTSQGEFFLVESAGRGGGFMVADGIVPQTSGFDLATASALQAVGMAPPFPAQLLSKAVVLRFIPSKAGTVAAIKGFDSHDNIEGVISEPLVVTGQTVGRASSDGDRMAYILAAADTVDEAQRRADLKEQRIHITVT